MNGPATKADLKQALERQMLRLTVRLGGFMAASFGLLGVLVVLSKP